MAYAFMRAEGFVLITGQPGTGKTTLVGDVVESLADENVAVVEAIEELRLLTNLQEGGRPLVQIFLLGQPELQDLVHSPGLEQVLQRIVAASRMEPLREDETRAYVEHRLRRVGWVSDPVISTAVFPVIYRFSGGIPRRINLICSRLLLHSAVKQQHHITVADARDVVQELQDEQLSTANILHDDVFHAEDEYELVVPNA